MLAFYCRGDWLILYKTYNPSVTATPRHLPLTRTAFIRPLFSGIVSPFTTLSFRVVKPPYSSIKLKTHAEVLLSAWDVLYKILIFKPFAEAF